jgi:hypothetical protein
MGRIISRAEWGAVPASRAPVVDFLPWRRMWAHHTAGPQGGIAVVKQIQKQHQARGWRDIAYNLLKVAAGGGIAIGPVLLGADKPVHILTPSATVRRIVNMTALTVMEANTNI